MNVLSLFDGIGTGRLALERAGIKVDNYFASEIEQDAITVAKTNFPDIIELGDINKYYEWELPQIDMVIGGSPCQNLSNCNRYKEGLDGKESSLFFRYLDVLEKFKPRYFLLENVASMSNKNKDLITQYLVERGGDSTTPIEINSSLLSAQNRNRIYWTNIPNIEKPKDKKILFKNLISSNRKDWRPVGEWVNKPFYDGKVSKKDMLKTFNAEKSSTLTTKKGHPQNYYLSEDGKMYSNLTADEYELLQTLPLGYTNMIKDAARYKAIGNGWTCDVIAHIFSFLPKEYKNKE